MIQPDDIIEHVYMGAEVPDPDPDPDQERVTHRRLLQRNDLKGYAAKIRIFNEHFVEVQIKTLGSRLKEYWVDLSYLDPKPERRTVIAWPWLGATLTLAVLSVLLIAFHSPQSGLSSAAAMQIAILLSAGAGIALLGFLHNTGSRWLFFTRHGRAALLTLLGNNPTRAELNEMLTELTSRIGDAREGRFYSFQEWLSRELREHRRLREEGVLSESQYEAAKARILNCHE